ncbi:PfkB family carbohydrate kinase [Pelagibacteraceae bacterium]|jgi:rfaE bifunctional protein kinase chain/domain/rfaE bifunctional protein nucleotidyltransferase chain/domain|nr:PfkB family carbohydrate kinase [Pelagibacteraceae bacterium]
MKKIFTISALKKEIKKVKNKNLKIVHCHGVFDLIHIGHIKHFKEAKKNGDFLVVSITADKFVNKGSGRPIFNQNLRAEFLSFLTFVDSVTINENQTSEKLISIIKPDIYFKGPDYKNNQKDRTKNIFKEVAAVKKFGGKVIYSNDITFSSSNLINTYSNYFDEHQKNFLKQISKKYTFDFIFKKLKELEKLKVLLVGETIIDQYIFGDVLGKSGKEPHLVLNEKKSETYLGGAAAIANHLGTFCKSVNFLTLAGKEKNNLSFIKKLLRKNIDVSFFNKVNVPTIIKKRYIDEVSKNKLLGVYSISDEKLKENLEKKLINCIKKNSILCDLVLVSDYGHGFISKKTSTEFNKSKIFFSLNAQINASNRGFHSLIKYKNIDSLIINENELRHEMRDKSGNIEKMGLKLIKYLNIKKLVITRGSKGAVLIEKTGKAIYAPAFANKIIDKVGAGDAMLAVISLCMKIKMPSDLSLFLGSLAGATAVESIGNSSFINKDEMIRKIQFSIK